MCHIRKGLYKCLNQFQKILPADVKANSEKFLKELGEL